MTNKSWIHNYRLSLIKLPIRELMNEMLMYYRIYVIKNDDMNCKEFTLYKECQSELIKRFITIKDMVNGENK